VALAAARRSAVEQVFGTRSPVPLELMTTVKASIFAASAGFIERYRCSRTPPFPAGTKS
jgi:hypothetical protein